MSEQTEARKYNQAQFTALVARESGVSVGDTERVLRAAYDVVSRVVISGGSVAVTNFGTWRSTELPAGMRRNPQTGERFPVQASRRPAFRFSPTLRAAVKLGEAPATFKKRGNGLGRG